MMKTTLVLCQVVALYPLDPTRLVKVWFMDHTFPSPSFLLEVPCSRGQEAKVVPLNLEKSGEVWDRARGYKVSSPFLLDCTGVILTFRF